MQSHSTHVRTHTPHISQLHSILDVAETECNSPTGISETYNIKKAFHYRLSVIFNTILTV